jgi:hypothetical protein
MPTRKQSRPAFSIHELLVTVAVIATVISILLVISSDNLRRSRAAGSIDNLRFFGSGSQTYAADHNNRFWTFSWTAGQHQTEYPDLNFSATDLEAAANQAVYIIRRMGHTPELPRIQSWVPHVQYSYLALFEHLGMSIPSRVAVSPEDRTRLSWQRDAAGFLAVTARPSGNDPSVLRWIYSSSYEIGPAFWSPDAAVAGQGAVSNSGTHSIYLIPSNTPLGNRTLDQVRFPASKAHLWETHQRDLGRRVPFYAFHDARVPVLTVDGSVSVRAARYTNPGFQPASPHALVPLTLNYTPDPAWEPPTITPGQTQDVVQARQRYTRWGLRGRDFNGPEVTAP